MPGQSALFYHIFRQDRKDKLGLQKNPFIFVQNVTKMNGFFEYFTLFYIFFTI